MRKGRRRIWLPVAALLFLLAALLMHLGDPAAPAAEAPRVEFPRAMDRAARARAEARLTLPARTDVPAGAQAPARPRDPLLSALPPGPGGTVVVLEANAIANSPLGEMFLACMGAGNGKGPEQLKERLGLDLARDVDRVAVTPGGVTVTGHFGETDWDRAFPEASRSAYGDRSRIYELPIREVQGPDGSSRPGRAQAMGVWNGSLITTGTPEEVRAALDRVEGRGEPGEPSLDSSQTYGEVYGTIGIPELLELLGKGEDQQALREQLLRVATGVELHADTSSDVGLVARVAGDDPGALRDLGKSMGGLLAAARLKARADGDDEAVRLLEMASVQQEDGSFNLELALPRSFLEERTAECRRRSEARRSAREAGEDDASGMQAVEFKPVAD